MEVSGDSADFRAGQFIESWGIADTFNPIDVLNRRDLGVNVLDPEVLGETGVRLRYNFEGGSTIGQPAVALYVMPLWRETPFPTKSSRFSFSQNGPRFRDKNIERLDVIDGGLAAIRFEHTLDTGLVNADMQYIVARGPDRSPTFIFGEDSRGPFLRPEYFGTWVGGGGFRAIPNADGFSKFTLKAEVVHKRPYKFGVPQYRRGQEMVQSQAFQKDRSFESRRKAIGPSVAR